jgi:hypothetical protein
MRLQRASMQKASLQSDCWTAQGLYSSFVAARVQRSLHDTRAPTVPSLHCSYPHHHPLSVACLPSVTHTQPISGAEPGIQTRPAGHRSYHVQLWMSYCQKPVHTLVSRVYKTSREVVVVVLPLRFVRDINKHASSRCGEETCSFLVFGQELMKHLLVIANSPIHLVVRQLIYRNAR